MGRFFTNGKKGTRGSDQAGQPNDVCHKMWRSHASLSVAVIIGRSPTSFCRKVRSANFGKHHSKNAPLSVDKSAFFVEGSYQLLHGECEARGVPLWCRAADGAPCDAIYRTCFLPRFSLCGGGMRPAFACRQASPPNKKPTTKVGFLFGGGSWIRTSEVSDNRFTVCPLWPLGNSPILRVQVEYRNSFGAGERSRTINLLITNQLLCH